MDSFLKYYESPERRPIFETVDEMLKWAGLYNLTTRTLRDELIGIKLSPLLIEEFVTVSITSYLCLYCFKLSGSTCRFISNCCAMLVILMVVVSLPSY